MLRTCYPIDKRPKKTALLESRRRRPRARRDFFARFGVGAAAAAAFGLVRLDPGAAARLINVVSTRDYPRAIEQTQSVTGTTQVDGVRNGTATLPRHQRRHTRKTLHLRDRRDSGLAMMRLHAGLLVLSVRARQAEDS